ncbi:hypothetical protein [Anaeroselena agilis]|uniref:Zinc ribbon domain-containing protein n=1 Tax=Anaeroselena agilis TaxID=3063788 RepID=A0ABU3NVM4_9FIRM|nr:hypothetical protein [Selenomonadales bacterium 4137-cl]
MKCSICGRDIAPDESACPYCRESDGQVKVLTSAERESFQGVTLDDGPSEEERRYQYERGGQRIHVRQFSFGGKSSLLTKLIILAVIGVVVFVVLPVFFLFFAAAGLLWFIVSLLRR